jgi:sec-independent protein translocase protein TatA
MLAIGMPGLPELLIIGFIMLLLFGNRLPSLMRSLGRGVVEFKQGLHGVDDDFGDDGEKKAVEEKPSESISKPSESISKPISEK